MPNYHVGCGEISSKIYAGTLKKNGIEWLNRSDVTHEALCAAAQCLLFGGKEFRFQNKGQWYVMHVDEFNEVAE